MLSPLLIRVSSLKSSSLQTIFWKLLRLLTSAEKGEGFVITCWLEFLDEVDSEFSATSWLMAMAPRRERILQIAQVWPPTQFLNISNSWSESFQHGTRECWFANGKHIWKCYVSGSHTWMLSGSAVIPIVVNLRLQVDNVTLLEWEIVGSLGHWRGSRRRICQAEIKYMSA